MEIAQLQGLLRPGSTTLANMVGTPDQASALAVLGRILLGDDQATADQIGAAILAGGADAALKIQQAEQELRRQIARAGTTLERIAGVQLAGARLDTLARLDQQSATDRQKAREFQAQTHDTTSRYLAYAVTAAFFIALMAVIIVPYAKGAGLAPFDNPLAQTLLGVLGTGWVSIISFYFGSSVGSKEKTALLSEAVVPTASGSPGT